MSDSKNILHVSLDTLLDTRLATVAKVDPAASVRLYNNPAYWDREADQFTALCGVDQAAYEAAYRTRDVETLKLARPTAMALMLNEIARKMERDAIDSPRAEGYAIELNTYPYQLPAETSRLVALAVQARAGAQTLVHPTYLPPSELTPQYCRTHYSGMILYDFAGWWGVQMDALMQSSMARVGVVAPALFMDVPPPPEDRVVKGIEQANPFMLTELALVEWVSLDLIAPALFSIEKD